MALLLKVAGLSQATIFSNNSLKDVFDKIGKAAIASNPRGYNSIVVPYIRKAEVHNYDKAHNDKAHNDKAHNDKVHDNGPHDDGPHNDGLVNNKLRYAMGDDTLIRWYCNCHGLMQLSFMLWQSYPCPRGGLLCLTHKRARQSKPQNGFQEPASWQLLGSHNTRTQFINNISKFHEDFAVVHVYKPHGVKRRDFFPWKDPMEEYARPLKTVILDDTLLQDILNRLERFVNHRRICLKRGLPHKLGIIFHGPPGTGKSSFVNAIAHHLKFPIYVFSIGDHTLTDSHLMAMSDGMPMNAIALFEDVDRAKIGDQGMTEAGFLNVLDGVGRSDGRLTIMTCNALESIPEAAMRKGRIDKKYYFKLASRTQVKDLFLNTNSWSSKETEGLDLNDMAGRFVKEIPDNTISPAEVVAHLRESDSPEEAIKCVSKLLKIKSGGQEAKQ
jgi:hypothetical protein